MFDLSQAAAWLGNFAAGFVAGALAWRALSLRWIREIEEHWQGENADLRDRWVKSRLDGLDASPRKQGVRAQVAQTAPEPASQPPGPDDLTRIKGIGEKLGGLLNGMGVTTYAQIAAWSDADIDRVQGQLRFPGRVRRDKWVEKAREEHYRKYGERIQSA